jgi:hypothetical protein
MNDLLLAIIVGILYLILIMSISKLREVLTEKWSKDTPSEDEQYSFIYILDYSVPAIYEIEINEENYKDLDDLKTIEDILKRYKIKESQCSYMFSQERLSLHYINDKINDKLNELDKK